MLSPLQSLRVKCIHNLTPVCWLEMSKVPLIVANDHIHKNTAIVKYSSCQAWDHKLECEFSQFAPSGYRIWHNLKWLGVWSKLILQGVYLKWICLFANQRKLAFPFLRFNHTSFYTVLRITKTLLTEHYKLHALFAYSIPCFLTSLAKHTQAALNLA